jgi:hypothetical protein
MHHRKLVAHHIKCRGAKPHAWDEIVQSLKKRNNKDAKRVKLELKANHTIRFLKSTTEILRVGHPDRTFFLVNQLGHIIIFTHLWTACEWPNILNCFSLSNDCSQSLPSNVSVLHIVLARLMPTFSLATTSSWWCLPTFHPCHRARLAILGSHMLGV